MQGLDGSWSRRGWAHCARAVCAGLATIVGLGFSGCAEQETTQVYMPAKPVPSHLADYLRYVSCKTAPLGARCGLMVDTDVANKSDAVIARALVDRYPFASTEDARACRTRGTWKAIELCMLERHNGVVWTEARRENTSGVPAYQWQPTAGNKQTAVALLPPDSDSPGGEESLPSAAKPAPAPPATSSVSVSSAPPAKGQPGRLRYLYVEPKNPKYLTYVVGIVESPVLKDAVARISRILTFPKDVVIQSQECGGVANAMYLPNQHGIVLCYELMDAIYVGYASKVATSTIERVKISANALSFIAIHEAAHAFLGENNRPVLGSEEDVADNVSSLFFVAIKEFSAPYHGTRALVALESAKRTFADEHSFGPQRYFASLCLLYGSDPKRFGALVGPESKLMLPPERAERCPREWSRKLTALLDLVGPYMEGVE